MFSIKSSSLAALSITLLGTFGSASATNTGTLNAGQAIPMKGVSLATATTDPRSPPVENFQDKIYTIDITLGGQPFSINVDTGSSDLWVLPSNPQSLKLTQTTDVSFTESYDIGQASGVIQFAELEFAGYTIPSQAFLLASSSQNLFIIENHVCDGMLGLSFQSLSWISYLLQPGPNPNPDSNATAGAPALYNVFAQNTFIPSSFDMQLHRATDLGETPDGSFVIGAHLASAPGDVDAAPRLPIAMPGRWAVVLDQMSVNGKAFEFAASVVPGVPSGKIAAVIDSGFTFPPIPPAAVDFIYGGMPGAAFNQQGGNWIVPCNATADVVFTFGGVDFPMHYLDITYIFFSEAEVNGQFMNLTYCSNTFTRNQASSIDQVDANLGDPFMRNAYVSFNFNGLTPTGENSYMQMLPTTNFSAALPDFQASRAQTLASLPPELPPAEFLAALHGQSVSPSDLITSHVFDAPPATAAGTSSQSASSVGSSPTALTVTAGDAVSAASAASGGPSSSTSISGPSASTTAGNGGSQTNAADRVVCALLANCVFAPFALGLLSAIFVW